jgi:CspA family cold shock protein
MKYGFILLKIKGYIMSNTAIGTVKWFNETKGFGFIQQDTGPDVFAHFKEISSSGFKTLYEGQRVTFNIAQGQKGPTATNIIAQ